jgi:hypothetical protein
MRRPELFSWQVNFGIYCFFIYTSHRPLLFHTLFTSSYYNLISGVNLCDQRQISSLSSHTEVSLSIPLKFLVRTISMSDHNVQLETAPKPAMTRLETIRAKGKPVAFAVMCGSVTLDTLNVTGLAFCQVNISEHFGVNLPTASWSLSAYALTFGSFLLIAGRLGACLLPLQNRRHSVGHTNSA